jgi:predicted PurR-regulated permease PerM
MIHFSFRRFFVIFIGIAIAWSGIRYLLPALIPFLFAALLALAAEPLVGGLERRFRFKRGLASGVGVSVVLVLTVLLLLTLCALLVRQLGALTGVLPDLENATTEGLASLEGWLLSLAEKTPGGIRPILAHGVEGIFSDGSALLDNLTARL